MVDNQDYPWYLQKSVKARKIYDGLFPVAVQATPLDIWKFIDIDQLTGNGLLTLGRLFGLRGTWGAISDGLVYDIDKWSEDKVWTGHMKDLDGQIYRNFIKMKAYIYEKPYNLITLKGAMETLLDGMDYEMTVTEEYMHFTINIKAQTDVLNIFYNLSKYDAHFLGKPVGVSYDFKFENKE